MNSLKLIAVSVLAVGAACGTAFAEDLPAGRIYAFHSSAQAGCPLLDWHVVLEAGGTLAGMISWDGMKSVARVDGSIDMTTRKFQMGAKEIGGQGRTATIDGIVRPDNGWLTANIKGPNVNCQGISVPWFTPPPSSGG